MDFSWFAGFFSEWVYNVIPSCLKYIYIFIFIFCFLSVIFKVLFTEIVVSLYFSFLNFGTKNNFKSKVTWKEVTETIFRPKTLFIIFSYYIYVKNICFVYYLILMFMLYLIKSCNLTRKMHALISLYSLKL